MKCCEKHKPAILMPPPTECRVSLLQELHFHNLIDGRSILQLIYERCHQVLVVAGEDAQMVAGLVAQLVVVVCVEPHKYGGATANEMRALGRDAALR